MWWDLIKDCWRVLRKRDSESALCSMIGVSSLLSDRHLREARDYCESLLANRKGPATLEASDDGLDDVAERILDLTTTKTIGYRYPIHAHFYTSGHLETCVKEILRRWMEEGSK